MHDADRPTLPSKPELPARARTSWLAIGLVGFVGLALAVVLTFLTVGYFGPVLLLGAAVFFVIGLQYLVWGWWFERVYRQHEPNRDE
jgi:CHASE2 domain-containing sensor protein